MDDRRGNHAGDDGRDRKILQTGLIFSGSGERVARETARFLIYQMVYTPSIEARWITLSSFLQSTLKSSGLVIYHLAPSCFVLLMSFKFLEVVKMTTGISLN